MEWLVYAVVGYCLADFVLGMLLGRCVVPGLKCKACRGSSDVPSRLR